MMIWTIFPIAFNNSMPVHMEEEHEIIMHSKCAYWWTGGMSN